MTNKIQIIILSILIPLGALYWYTQMENVSLRDLFLPGSAVMRFADIPVRVEIANSPEELKKGLSGRERIEHVNGLLFVFPETDYHSIWMKDMKFAIDIIWISEDLEVINIEKNVTPDTYPRSFRPSAPARYAVETNVHYADTLGIRPGQKVKLPQNYLED